MNIGLDLDGVLIDITFVFTCAIRNTIRIKASWNDYSAGLDLKTFATIHDQVVSDGGLMLCDVYKDNLETLREISENHEIFYITSRRSMLGQSVVNTIMRGVTPQFMKLHKFPTGKIIFTQDKVSVCEANGITIMVEDHFETSQKFFSTSVRCYLIDRPWNKGSYVRFGEYDYPYRVRNLEVVVKREKLNQIR